MRPEQSTEINLARWDRYSIYSLFRQTASPHLGVTADIDITRLMEQVKPRQISMFNACLFAIMSAVNRIPELRTRFKDDRVYQYPTSHPSFTVPIEGDRFAFCEFPFDPVWAKFDLGCRAAIARGRQQQDLTENAKSDRWTYLSCIPWIHFTNVSHPHNGPEDCIPRIAWGKFSRRENRWFMPLNVQAHHALVDGLHAARFMTLTETILAEEPFD
jgi:chloramphenicol O-acetyltransferase type A